VHQWLTEIELSPLLEKLKRRGPRRAKRGRPAASAFSQEN
jgi:hypothetical protein